jgi:hypothetical protein
VWRQKRRAQYCIVPVKNNACLVSSWLVNRSKPHFLVSQLCHKLIPNLLISPGQRSKASLLIFLGDNNFLCWLCSHWLAPFPSFRTCQVSHYIIISLEPADSFWHWVNNSNLWTCFCWLSRVILNKWQLVVLLIFLISMLQVHCLSIKFRQVI